MANYYATARSNYFRVKDEQEFRNWASSRGLMVFEKAPEEEVKSFMIHPGDISDDGAWPSQAWVEHEDEVGGGWTEDWEEIDIVDELAEHLEDGSVAVLMEAGSEKHRYVCGYATAVNSNGTVVSLSLVDIYEKARKVFGKKAEITDCSY